MRSLRASRQTRAFTQRDLEVEVRVAVADGIDFPRGAKLLDSLQH